MGRGETYLSQKDQPTVFPHYREWSRLQAGTEEHGVNLVRQGLKRGRGRVFIRPGRCNFRPEPQASYSPPPPAQRHVFAALQRVGEDVFRTVWKQGGYDFPYEMVVEILDHRRRSEA